MRFPKLLKKGDRIGIIAPSFGGFGEPYHTRLKEAVKNLTAEGYEIVCGPNAFCGEGIGKSNTAIKCAQEANDFFVNKGCRALIAAGGGETMCEDLPFMDFDAIAKAEPVWYAGYSDNTNFILPLVTMCDTAAVYSPCASEYGTYPFTEQARQTLELMSGERTTVHNYDKWELEAPEDEEPLAAPFLTEPFCMKMWMPGDDRSFTNLSPEGRSASFGGRIIGGCLDCLQVLAGTPYEKVKEFNKRYGDEGIVWFLESCELGPMSIRRAVWQLKEAGWFEHVKGFLIGRPMRYGIEELGLNSYGAYLGVLSEFNVPVLMDLDIGHLAQMMPIVCGSTVKITTENNSFSMEQQLK